MSKDGNKKKDEQLGMKHGTAAGRLRKEIMFMLLQEAGKDVCFQCGERIKCARDLSVEHKVPWLDSNDPIGLYFDMNNIAFSHLACNIGAARNGSVRTKEHGRAAAYRRGCRCVLCRAWKSVDNKKRNR